MRKELQHVRDVVARVGVVASLRRAFASILWRLDTRHAAVRAVMRENAAFDRLHGTDTGGEIPLTRLGITPEAARHGNGVYRAISTSHFEDALRLFPHRHEDFVFIDYGSGKGKALLLAAAHPYRRIIGVEYAPLLHQQARLNLRRARNLVPRQAQIDTVCANACDYVPPDDALVCFFFNPFDAATWRVVLSRLQQQFQANQRTILIVYLNIRDITELGDVFCEFPQFVTVARKQTVHILMMRA
ncbi:MAG TPA: class I SAM-dependent methyltransferase, partial [Arenimonas sp.]|nr:class I SAM-dependent methyltransferase [Arenimonas sp.]